MKRHGKKLQVIFLILKLLKKGKTKKRFKGLYHSLENIAKESIDINVDEFSGASTIKFAYLNGIKIEG